MTALRIYLLGAPQIELDGVAVESDRNKAVALLAYLAVSKGMHSRESLATLLWPEYDQSRAYANLRRTLWELNSILGEGWIKADRETIGLAGERDAWLDVDQFESLVNGCSQHLPATIETCSACMQAFIESTELYRGDFLAGFNLRDSPDFDNWKFFQSENLRQRMALVLQSLVSCFLAAGDPQSAVVYGLRWLSMDSLNEEAHRQLMLAFVSGGQRTAALRQYQECVRVLAEELNVDPEPETTQLFVKIRDGLIDRLPARGEPPDTPTPQAHVIKLPSLPGPFIGREEDLAKILLLLQDNQCHLLTLVGLGGIGKTRLAVEVGTRIIEHVGENFPHGIFFISLAPLSSADSLISTIADALNYTFQGEEIPSLRLESQHKQLLDFLHDKELLLILDNFEHLLSGVDFLSEIVATSERAKLLVTSRERLNLKEEWTYEVRGMDYPEEGSIASLGEYSAVQLFLQNAERVRAGQWMPLEEMSSIARICRLLKGVPLALELASTWTKTLSPHEIVNEIEQSLDFLVTPLRGVDERHHSLRAVFDRSWELLDADEQAVFSRLSVFQGPFSREGAAQVTGAALPILSSLIDKSLIRRESKDRYVMHELVKQFAAEKLVGFENEEVKTRDLHAKYYTQELIDIENDLKGARQVEALNLVEEELENISAAWHWSVVREDLDAIYGIGFVLFLFLTIRNRFQEGNDATSMAIQQLRNSIAEMPTPARLEVLAFMLGMQRSFFFALENVDGANRAEQECLSIMRQIGLLTQAWDERESFPYILYLPIFVSFGSSMNDQASAEAMYLKTVSGFEKVEDTWGLALAKEQFSQVLRFKFFDHSRVKELLDDSYRLFRKLGNLWGVAISLTGLANVSLLDGDYEGTIHYAMESLEICDEMGDRWRTIDNYFKVGMASVAIGAYATAKEYYAEGLKLIRDLGSRFVLSSLLDSVGYVDYLLKDYDAAEAAYRESLVVSLSNGDERGQGMALQNIGDVLRARGDWEKAAEYYRQGIELLGKDTDLWQRAVVWKKLGIVYRETSDIAKAKESLTKALSLAAKGSTSETINVLIEYALLLDYQGEPEKAVEILSICKKHPALSVDSKEKIEQMFGIIKTKLSSDLFEASLQQTRELKLDEIVEELSSSLY